MRTVSVLCLWISAPIGRDPQPNFESDLASRMLRIKSVRTEPQDESSAENIVQILEIQS